jgi:hypothetical protein
MYKLTHESIDKIATAISEFTKRLDEGSLKDVEILRDMSREELLNFISFMHGYLVEKLKEGKTITPLHISKQKAIATIRLALYIHNKGIE